MLLPSATSVEDADTDLGMTGVPSICPVVRVVVEPPVVGVVEESFPVVRVVETVLVVDAKEAVLLGPLFVFWPKNVPYAICATTKTATTSNRRRTTAKMRVLFRGRRGSPRVTRDMGSRVDSAVRFWTGRVDGSPPVLGIGGSAALEDVMAGG